MKEELKCVLIKPGEQSVDIVTVGVRRKQGLCVVKLVE